MNVKKNTMIKQQLKMMNFFPKRFRDNINAILLQKAVERAREISTHKAYLKVGQLRFDFQFVFYTFLIGFTVSGVKTFGFTGLT